MSDQVAQRALTLAYHGSAADIDLLARGSGLEGAVGRALAVGDKKLLAVYLERLLREQPEREAAAKVRSAMLDSPAATMLLDRVVTLMLHPATTPEALREAAELISQHMEHLK